MDAAQGDLVLVETPVPAWMFPAHNTNLFGPV